MSKLVILNILPGIRLPHNIEGVDVHSADMLIDPETKHRLMTLRPNLFRKDDPDWPKKVLDVKVVEGPHLVGEAKPELVVGKAVTPKKGKETDGDNPS